MTLCTRIEGREEAAWLAFLIGCEEADFLWAARAQERWLGRYESLDDYDGDHDRVAICGMIEGLWFAGIVVIDGDGAVEELLRREDFTTHAAAMEAFDRLR